MSDAVPTHLAAELGEFQRYGFDGDRDRQVRLFADLIIAGTVPYSIEKEVQGAIDDGWLSPAGDVLRYASE